MKYLLFICAREGLELSPEDVKAAGPDTVQWVNEMDARGARLLGNRLEGVEQARTVQVRSGRLSVTDGPFAETKEQIAGFDIIECADMNEALEIAAKHPVARYGSVEVRPFWFP